MSKRKISKYFVKVLNVTPTGFSVGVDRILQRYHPYGVEEK